MPQLNLTVSDEVPEQVTELSRLLGTTKADAVAQAVAAKLAAVCDEQRIEEDWHSVPVGSTVYARYATPYDRLPNDPPYHWKASRIIGTLKAHLQDRLWLVEANDRKWYVNVEDAQNLDETLDEAIERTTNRPAGG